LRISFFTKSNRVFIILNRSQKYYNEKQNLLPDLIPLLVLILLGVLLSPLEGLDTLGLARELALDGLPGAQRPVLSLSLALLQHGLRHGGQLLVGHFYT
jgi:hypothetical protein